mgnify:CR=1 FL=1
MYVYLIDDIEVTFNSELEAAEATLKAEQDGLSVELVNEGPSEGPKTEEETKEEEENSIVGKPGSIPDDPKDTDSPVFQTDAAAESAEVVSETTPAQNTESNSEGGSLGLKNPAESTRFIIIKDKGKDITVKESEYHKVAGTADKFPKSFEDFATLYKRPIRDVTTEVYEGGELDDAYLNTNKSPGSELISLNETGQFRIDYETGLNNMPVPEEQKTQEAYVPVKKKKFVPNYAAKEFGTEKDHFRGVNHVATYNTRADELNLNITAEQRAQRVYIRNIEMIAARDILDSDEELKVSVENSIAANVDINDPEQATAMAKKLQARIEGMSLGRAEYLVSTYNDEKLAIANTNQTLKNKKIIDALPEESFEILSADAVNQLGVGANDVGKAANDLKEAEANAKFPELNTTAEGKYYLYEKEIAAREKYQAAMLKYKDESSILEFDAKGNFLGVKEKNEKDDTPLYDFKGNELTDKQVEARIAGGEDNMYDMQGRQIELGKEIIDNVTDRQKLKDEYTVTLVEQKRLNIEGQEIIWAKSNLGGMDIIKDPSFIFDAHLDKTKPQGQQYSRDKDGWIGHTKEVWGEMVASGDWNADDYRWRDGKKRTNDEFNEFTQAQRDANLKVPLLAEMVVLGMDPKSYGENGIKEGFTTFVEGALDNTPFIGKYVAKEWQSDIDKKNTLNKIFSDTNVTPTDAMAKAFYLNYGMKLANGMGAFMPVIGEFALATAVTGGVGSTRGVLGVIGATQKLQKALTSGTRAQKLAAHFTLGLLEEAKFSMVAGGKNEAGGGFGFYAGGALFGRFTKFLRFPKAHAYANNIMNKVVFAGAGGVSGQEVAVLTEAFYKSFKGDKTFQKSMKEMYGEDSAWMERISMGALQFGALGASKLRTKDFAMLGKVEQMNGQAKLAIERLQAKKKMSAEDKKEMGRQQDILFDTTTALRNADVQLENANIKDLDATAQAIERMMNNGKDVAGNPLSPRAKRFMQKRLDDISNKRDNITKEVTSQIENFNKEFKGEGITFELKELPGKEQGSVEGKRGEGEVKILIDPKKANVGTVVQELTHLAFEGISEKNPEIKIQMVDRIESAVDKSMKIAKANGYVNFEGTFRKNIEKTYADKDKYGQAEEYLGNLVEYMRNKPGVARLLVKNNALTSIRDAAIKEAANKGISLAKMGEIDLSTNNLNAPKQIINLLSAISGLKSKKGFDVADSWLGNFTIASGKNPKVPMPDGKMLPMEEGGGAVGIEGIKPNKKRSMDMEGNNVDFEKVNKAMRTTKEYYESNVDSMEPDALANDIAFMMLPYVQQSGASYLRQRPELKTGSSATMSGMAIDFIMNINTGGTGKVKGMASFVKTYMEGQGLIKQIQAEGLTVEQALKRAKDAGMGGGNQGLTGRVERLVNMAAGKGKYVEMLKEDSTVDQIITEEEYIEHFAPKEGFPSSFEVWAKNSGAKIKEGAAEGNIITYLKKAINFNAMNIVREEVKNNMNFTATDIVDMERYEFQFGGREEQSEDIDFSSETITSKSSDQMNENIRASIALPKGGSVIEGEGKPRNRVDEVASVLGIEKTLDKVSNIVKESFKKPIKGIDMYSSGTFESGGQTIKFQFPSEPNRASAFFSLDGKSPVERFDFVGVRSNKGLYEKVQKTMVTALNKRALAMNRNKEQQAADRKLASEIQKVDFRDANLIKDKLFKAELSAKIEVDAYEGIVKEMGKIGSVENMDFLSKAYPLSKNYIALAQLIKRFATIGEGIFFEPVMIKDADGKLKQDRKRGTGARASGVRQWKPLDYNAKEFIDFFKSDPVLQQSLAKSIAREMGIDVAVDALINNKMKYILNSTDATVAKIEVTELYKEKFITHIGRGGNIKKYSKDFEAAGILFGMDKAVSEMAMNDIIAAIKSGTSLTKDQEAFLTHTFSVYTDSEVAKFKGDVNNDTTRPNRLSYLREKPEEVIKKQTAFLGAFKSILGEFAEPLSQMSTTESGGKEFQSLFQHLGYNSEIMGGKIEYIADLVTENKKTKKGIQTKEYAALDKLNVDTGVEMMNKGKYQKLFEVDKLPESIKLEVADAWKEVIKLSKESEQFWLKANPEGLVKEGKIPYKILATKTRQEYVNIMKSVDITLTPDARRAAVEKVLKEAFNPTERLAIIKGNDMQLALNKATVVSFGALKEAAKTPEAKQALYMASDIITSNKQPGIRSASPELYFHVSDRLIGGESGNEHLKPFAYFSRHLREAVRDPKQNRLLDKDFINELTSGYVSLVNSKALQSIGDMLIFPSEMFNIKDKILVKSAYLPKSIKMIIATSFEKAATAKVRAGEDYKTDPQFKLEISRAQTAFDNMMKGKLSIEQILELNNIENIKGETALEQLFKDSIDKMAAAEFKSSPTAIKRGNDLLKKMGYEGSKVESTGEIKRLMKSKDMEGTFEVTEEGVQKTSEWEGEAVTYEKYLELKEENTKELFLPKRLAEMIEGRKGANAAKEVTSSKAYNEGRKKRGDLFVPYNSEDFQGLLYKVYGRGKKGNADMAFMKEHILTPLYEAENNLSVYRMRLAEDYKGLEEQMKELGSNKAEKAAVRRVEKLGYNIDQATRVYIWTRLGEDIPGISSTEQAQLMGAVSASPRLTAYAKGIMEITKTKEQYPKPSKNWFKSNIQYDLFTYATDGVRSDFLADWSANVDAMFHTGNLNKLEARFGSDYRYNLETMIARIKNGRSRIESTNVAFNKSLNYINGSVATIMFLNMRSAALQTISSVNYVNWTDNNPIAIGKVIAKNPLLFAKNMIKVWNSDALKDRRSGLRINVEEAEIAKAIQSGNQDGLQNVWNKMIQFGFKPTQMADSFAITLGGTPFYMNRIKTYEKEGLGKSEAENKAWIDFLELTQESQQSSQMDRVSNIQTGLMGRLIFSFNNTPFQMSRLQKKAALDLINNRGDRKANVSKLGYYAFVQSTLFYGMQQAFYSSFMGPDDEDLSEAQKLEKYTDFEKRVDKIGTSVFQGILTGSGLPGKVATTLYNTGRAVEKQYDKGYAGKEFYPILKEILAISPTLGSKANRLNRYWNSLIYSDFTKTGKAVKNTYSDFDPQNPNTIAYLGMIGTITNIPLDRIVAKMNNIQTALDSNRENWQRVAAAFGTPQYQIQTSEQNVRDREKVLQDFYVKTVPKRERDSISTRDLTKAEQQQMIVDLGITRDVFKGLTNEDKRVNYILDKAKKDNVDLEKIMSKYQTPKKTKTEQYKKLAKLTKIEQQQMLVDLVTTRSDFKKASTEKARIELIIKKLADKYTPKQDPNKNKQNSLK